MPLEIGMTFSSFKSRSSDATTKLTLLQQLQMVLLVAFNQLPESMCKASRTENFLQRTRIHISV